MPVDTTAGGHHCLFLIPGPISPFSLLLDPKEILSIFLLQYWCYLIYNCVAKMLKCYCEIGLKWNSGKLYKHIPYNCTPSAPYRSNERYKKKSKIKDKRDEMLNSHKTSILLRKCRIDTGKNNQHAWWLSDLMYSS